MTRARMDAPARGIALLAVLVALTLLLLLALPFSVSMSRGADAAQRAIEERQAELLSASARDLMLAAVAYGQPTHDATPACDDRSEFPAGVPDTFPQLGQDGRARMGGETQDLQRKIALDAVTPLLLANLIGTTARLAKELAPQDDALSLDTAANLPDSGFVWIDHEVVRYGQKQGNTLSQLERGLFREHGFLKPDDHTVAETAFVFDWRCVLAAAWPFAGRTGDARTARLPFAAPGELAEIERAGQGAFTLQELDRFAQALGEQADVATAPQWGRPERVFYGVAPPQRTLTVKSALHLGAGSTVRLRNLKTGVYEYGLVMSAATPRNEQELQLPSVFTLDLLHPVTQAFPAIDTVVEPLVPAPVNVNTAEPAVLAALMAGCRRGMDVRVHDASGQRRMTPPQPFSVGEAQELAAAIVALREQAPFAGFAEFADQVFRPRLADAGQEQKLRLLYLYRLLLTGRDSVVEMGTAPIAFASGPLVAYRAAASLQRSVVATGLAARHERTGVAVALPGLLLQGPWRTQEDLEEAFRLDQRAPFYLTGPVNTGSPGGGDLGNDPVSRYVAHVVAMAFPDAGLGETRFPSRDAADAAIVAGPSSVVANAWQNGNELRGHEAFSTAIDPRGRDLGKQGPFLIRNTGPRDAGPAPAAPRTHELTYPFTVAAARGGAGRFALAAWFEPDALSTGTLFDYSDGNVERNRMALLVRDGKLVFEVLDEAGLDPDWTASPAGVERTACTWSLPLSDLALPPKTPVHVAVSAFAGRPSDLAVAVDGMVRGTLRYRTTLTAAVPGYDPQQSPSQPPGQATNDPRYLLLQVEDTEGFPPRGIVRVGTELFEYVGIQGNALVCAFLDSTGGRGARQIAREMRPDIPVDGNGEPTVDIDSLGGSGVNLDQFPEHPAGAEVELFGYSVEPQADTLLYPGETSVDGTLGGFAVARGWLPNGRPIQLQAGPITIPVGTGLDLTWTGDLTLADPLPTGSTAPQQAQASIADAFPTGGGYALLVQRGFRFTPNFPGQPAGLAVQVGGIEVIRYASRQGSRLSGVQRAVRLPGDDAAIDRQWYDGTAHNFVVDWNDGFAGRGSPPVKYDDDPRRILNVVPISISVQSAAQLADPETSGFSEWAQLWSRGGDPNDTEWVRYDALLEQRYLLRTNRARWDAVRFVLTDQGAIDEVQVGQLGPSGGTDPSATSPFGTVTATAGYIGYVPKLEADFPQVQLARGALAFRGDPFTGTSSHAQSGASVLPCHRFDFAWGNFGAMTGRPGRTDRVALVAGSAASGSQRPGVEWHTVHWSARRYGSDVTAGQQRPPSELLGPSPFQLAAFQAPVQIAIRGRAAGAGPVDSRTVDRMVKFPSGELPAAACEAVGAGGSASGGEQQSGIVDEIHVVDHVAHDLLVAEAFGESALQFELEAGYVTATGRVFTGTNFGDELPPGGGLLQIDAEILAYSRRADGTVTIAQDGRGLLGTEPRGHDRGARVHFLTHRPAAILTGSVSPRSDQLPVQVLGAMPSAFGTVLLHRGELLHYTWVRRSGDAAILEMPRAYPPGEDGDSTGARGLFRGRYGTTPIAAGSGEAVILMPFRYWDRHVERQDDPEQAYFQCTTREAPVYFRTLQWQEEVQDGLVDVVCLVRADGRAAWTDEPSRGGFLRRLQRAATDQQPAVLDLQATQLEVRFVTEYKPGCLDLQTHRAHGWKTAPKIRAVELQYEGEGRILTERETAR